MGRKHVNFLADLWQLLGVDAKDPVFFVLQNGNAALEIPYDASDPLGIRRNCLVAEIQTENQGLAVHAHDAGKKERSRFEGEVWK